MTRSLTRLQALLLGIAVVLGLGLLAVGLFAVGNQQWLWGRSFHLLVGFDTIHGVEVGTRVRVLGRYAGEVTAIALPSRPGEQVVLTLKIDEKLRPLVRSDASARIVAEGMVGGKVIEIDPGTSDAEVVADGQLIASRKSNDVTDVLLGVHSTVAEANRTLREIRDGKGTIGKLLRDPQAYDELVRFFRDGQRTIQSLKQNSDAIKRMPLVRSYVRDVYEELIRPDCSRNRWWFREEDLFERGHAVLTAGGRARLDAIAPKINGLKHKGSEVVIASFADPHSDADFSRNLTQKQSETVAEYLKSKHEVHKMGWFSWPRRVVALGMGNQPTPVQESEPLPARRVEVVVFVPQHR
ncbi:MAG: hypothetical protein KatS3mg105_4576 [Gemmatales bacterium]|nr:MAG: hypothetical protein KatS3mg105_4576 [Gemmatales bacterium]